MAFVEMQPSEEKKNGNAIPHSNRQPAPMSKNRCREQTRDVTKSDRPRFTKPFDDATETRPKDDSRSRGESADQLVERGERSHHVSRRSLSGAVSSDSRNSVNICF